MLLVYRRFLCLQQIQNKNIYTRNREMSKQKLAQMVMQKIKQKKQQQQRNRPHYEVLQLLVKFQIQQYDTIAQQISSLQSQIHNQTQFLNNIDANCQQLENTGKKAYPRYLIQPNFIASQNIAALTKQFYRKSANTFLREDLLKKKRYEQDYQTFEQIKKKLKQLKDLQNQKERQTEKTTKIINEKRVRNLKQDLRLRALRQDIKQIKETIQKERADNSDLLKQYQLKKTNLNQRVDWCNKLKQLIHQQKNHIQSVYNPVTYREYLKTVFGIRIKNESMQKNLLQVLRLVTEVEKSTQKNQRFLQATDNHLILGKCADSPSKKKRKPAASLQLRREPAPKMRNKTSGSIAQSPSNRNNKGSRMSSISKTFSSSLGKTTAGSTFNLKQDSSKKRSKSSFSEFKNKKIRALQY